MVIHLPHFRIFWFYLFRAIEWYIGVNAAFLRDVDVGMQRTEGAFRSAVQVAGHFEDVNLDKVRKDLTSQIDRYTNLGSGWSLSHIKNFTIHVAQYRPLAGSSNIETPTAVVHKHAVINVQNYNDNECFRWAILSALYPNNANIKNVFSYTKYINEINWDGLRFRVTLAQIHLFARNNTNVAVNVYVYEEEDAVWVYITKHGFRRKHIDLLLLKNEKMSHYVWIKNMSALVCHRSERRKKVFVRTVFTLLAMQIRSIVIFPTAHNTSVRKLFYLTKTRTNCFGSRLGRQSCFRLSCMPILSHICLR